MRTRGRVECLKSKGMLTPVCSALYRYDHDTKIVTMAPSGAGVPVDRPLRAAASAGAPPEVRGLPVRCNEVGGIAPHDGPQSSTGDQHSARLSTIEYIILIVLPVVVSLSPVTVSSVMQVQQTVGTSQCPRGDDLLSICTLRVSDCRHITGLARPCKS